MVILFAGATRMVATPERYWVHDVVALAMTATALMLATTFIILLRLPRRDR